MRSGVGQDSKYLGIIDSTLEPWALADFSLKKLRSGDEEANNTDFFEELVPLVKLDKSNKLIWAEENKERSRSELAEELKKVDQKYDSAELADTMLPKDISWWGNTRPKKFNEFETVVDE